MASNLVLDVPLSAASREGRGYGTSLKPRPPLTSGTEANTSSRHGSIIKREQGSSNLKKRDLGGKESSNMAVPEIKGIMTQDIDPSSYRNSIFHNISTDMLEKGFHQSFSELFHLVQRQRSDHERAGPGSILLEPLIEHNLTKLEYLRVQLTMAEDAQRANDLDTVYMAQRNLAQYFELTEDAKRTKDKWLSDHFYDRCLETAMMVHDDNRHKEGEAHCHVGLSLENRGDLMKAASHMEIFHQLARKHNWHTDSGDSYHEIVCEHLRRIYTSIAEEIHGDKPEMSITYLSKAYEVAREGGDTYQEGKASYRLGNAYERMGESDTAIKYHTKYLESCKYHGDNTGIGKAYEAMAKSFQNKGDLKNAVKFLEMYVSVGESAGLQDCLADACSAIGTIYNTMGDYDKAVEYFGRCYEICSQLDNTEALYSARVQYGIAKSHQFMGEFSSVLTGSVSSSETLQKLVAWKDARITPSEYQPVQRKRQPIPQVQEDKVPSSMTGSTDIPIQLSVSPNLIMQDSSATFRFSSGMSVIPSDPSLNLLVSSADPSREVVGASESNNSFIINNTKS